MSTPKEQPRKLATEIRDKVKVALVPNGDNWAADLQYFTCLNCLICFFECSLVFHQRKVRWHSEHRCPQFIEGSSCACSASLFQIIKQPRAGHSNMAAARFSPS